MKYASYVWLPPVRLVARCRSASASAPEPSPVAPPAEAAATSPRSPLTAALTAMSVASVPVKNAVPVVTYYADVLVPAPEILDDHSGVRRAPETVR